MDPSSTPRSCLYMANWSASRQLGFLSLLCSFEIFVSFRLSGMPVNWLGVAKCMTTINIHLTFFLLTIAIHPLDDQTSL